MAGSFDFLKRRLGIQNAKERVFSSHFDYAHQSLLYTPSHLPDPRQPDFGRLAAEEIVQLLKATHGRAFVLFTSYVQMRDIYERVRPKSALSHSDSGLDAANAIAGQLPLPPRTPCCLEQVRSGREWMCRASN